MMLGASACATEGRNVALPLASPCSTEGFKLGVSDNLSDGSDDSSRVGFPEGLLVDDIADASDDGCELGSPDGPFDV